MGTRRLALHWQILLGLVLGAVAGSLVNLLGGSAGQAFVVAYVRPFGTIFIRLITMIAAPLVLASLVVGASSITDPAKLGRIGAKTVALYLLTTAVAITIGVVFANIIQPGAGLPEDVSARLLAGYREQATTRIERAGDVSAIDQLVALVPTNPFEALATGNMLQIVFFALLVGVALTLIPARQAEPVVRVFSGFTDVLIKIVDLVMRLAPYGVFALIAAVTAEFGFETAVRTAIDAGGQLVHATNCNPGSAPTSSIPFIIALFVGLSLLIIGSVFLGAATLQEFALALFVGLASGAYSSVMVAAPITVWLKERATNAGRPSSAHACCASISCASLLVA